MFQFDADLNSVNTGVWGEFGNARFKIAHISNLKFQRALARLQQPHRRKIEAGSLDPKVNKDILAEAMAEGILLDWDQVVDSKKVATPYSKEAGKVALLKNVEFRDWVSDFAMNLQNFREEEMEELGND